MFIADAHDGKRAGRKMGRIRVWIADRDSEYSAALARILTNKYNDFHITAIKYDSFEWERETWQDAKEYDLILFDERDISRIQKIIDKHAAQLILLTTQSPEENSAGHDSAGDSPTAIYKYGGASAIASELRFRYAMLSGATAKSVSGVSTGLLAFAGAAGGVGKTAVSIAVARELSGYHKLKVLFLSMETPESIDLYMDGEGGGRGLSDYLYYLFSKNDNNVSSCPEAFLTVDRWGVEFFLPGRGRNELSELPPEKFLRFLSALSSARKYDCICFDITAASTENCFTFMQMMKQIILIDDGSPAALLKNKRFLKDLDAVGIADIAGSLVQVRNKWASQKTFEDAIQNREEADIFIEYDPESFRQTVSGMEIAMDRRFGLGVKKLAEEIRRKI